MEGTITIRLRAQHTTKGALPDIGFDASWLVKEIPSIEFKDADGNMKPIGDKYEVIEGMTSLDLRDAT
jgi:hypothetical protein